MMEKYGAVIDTYEIVIPIPGKPDDFQVVASDLSLTEAEVVQKENPKSIIRPER